MSFDSSEMNGRNDAEFMLSTFCIEMGSAETPVDLLRDPLGLLESEFRDFEPEPLTGSVSDDGVFERNRKTLVEVVEMPGGCAGVFERERRRRVASDPDCGIGTSAGVLVDCKRGIRGIGKVDRGRVGGNPGWPD